MKENTTASEINYFVLQENRNTAVYYNSDFVYKYLKKETIKNREVQINKKIRLSRKNNNDRLLYDLYTHESDRKKSVKFEKGVVMKFEKGVCDLFTYMDEMEKEIDSDLLLYITREMAMSVKQLHVMGYTHLDISLENFIIMSNGRIKLCDFGLSRKTKEIKGYVVPVSKSDYAPFEMKMKKKIKNPEKIDSYSLGVCVFYLFLRCQLKDVTLNILQRYGVKELCLQYEKYTEKDTHLERLSFILEYIINRTIVTSSKKRLGIDCILSVIGNLKVYDKSDEIIESIFPSDFSN